MNNYLDIVFPLMLVFLLSTGDYVAADEQHRVATDPPAVAQDEQETDEAEEEAEPSSLKQRIYRSPEERREAGLGTEITDWLKISGLLEIEKERTDNHYIKGFEFKEEEPTSNTLQVGLDAEWDEWLQLEVVYEIEYSRHQHANNPKYHSGEHYKFDEVQLSLDFDPLGIKLGRINVPFGEYFSYFVIGPLLEFGETRRDTVMLEWEFNEQLEMSLFGFESQADALKGGDDYDWGVSVELISEDESMRFGASYLSDLAESDEHFLQEYQNRYQDKVAAWGAYLLFGFEGIELTLETVQALSAFKELDAPTNRPQASNLEVAFLPSDNWLIAVRWAHSKELDEAPQHQYGLSVNWHALQHLNLSVDYIYGEFRQRFVFDDNDRELRHQHQIGGRVSFEF